jgi:hypothetical protein
MPKTCGSGFGSATLQYGLVSYFNQQVTSEQFTILCLRRFICFIKLILLTRREKKSHICRQHFGLPSTELILILIRKFPLMSPPRIPPPTRLMCKNCACVQRNYPSYLQCCRSGSVGFIRFWAYRIHSSYGSGSFCLAKKVRNIYFYCFVTS